MIPDVCLDGIRYEVSQGQAGARSFSNSGGGQVEFDGFENPDPAAVGIGQAIQGIWFVARPGHREEVSETDHFIGLMPGANFCQGVDSDDVPELRIGILGSQIGERMNGVGGSVPIDLQS